MRLSSPFQSVNIMKSGETVKLIHLLSVLLNSQ